MTQKPEENNNANAAFELTSQALLAEYSAMRDASLSREEIMSSLENFMMIIVSAAIVSLPTLIKEQQFLLFPIVSLILSIIGLTRRHHALVHADLSEYQSEVLQPQLTRLVRDVDRSEQLSEATNGLWRWRSFYRQRGTRGSLPRRLSRLWLSFGLEPLFVLTSVGFLLLFLYYRGTANWAPPELIPFLFAAPSCMWLTALFVRSIVRDSIQVMKR